MGRRERYEPGTGQHKLWLNIGGSAGHSALWAVDIDEGRLSDQGGRKWEVSLTTASDARGKAAEQQQAVKADNRQKTHQAKVEAAKEAIAAALRSIPGNSDTKSCIQERAGFNSKNQAFADAFAALLRTGRLVACEVTKGNRQPYEGYRYVFDDPQ